MSEQKQVCSPLSTLIGRDREIEEGRLLLQRPAIRLLTLTGMGGVGKTRLAQTIVEKVCPTFADGVWNISLASLNRADLLVLTLLQELGIREELKQSPRATLFAFLHSKHLLLLLDNFEQIITEAPLLGDLLEHCPNLKILVTSREMLRIRGEYVFQVNPLPLPDLHIPVSMAELTQNAAVQLFIQRVQSMHPAFPLTEENLRAIVEICKRLDGLPLAIELAAVRCKLFSPQALLERLEHRLPMLTHGMRDLPRRQQTLRNTLAWSYDLLSRVEQQLFRSLAIFTGGSTIEAAEYVCAGKADFLDTLTSLLEKNLLQRDSSSTGEPRLRMLETIREYGQECLQASNDYQDVQRRHGTYYLLLAEEAEPHLTGPEGLLWINRLRLEIDNIRQILSQWQTCGEHENSLRLGSALRYFWVLSGHGREGYRWLIKTLAVSPESPPQLRAKALLTSGILAPYANQAAQQAPICQESMQLFQELGDRRGMAEALRELGHATSWQGKHTEAHQLHTKSVALFQAIGDQQGLANAKLSLAKALHAQTANQGARVLAQESLHLFRDMHNRRGIAQTLGLLAFIAGYYQEHNRAIALAEESLQIFKELGEEWEVATQLHYVAELALRQNNAEHALECVEESLRTSRQVGNREAMARAHHLLAQVQQKRLGDTVSKPLLEQSLALYEELDNQEGVALVLLNLGHRNLNYTNYLQARICLERSFNILSQKENKPALIENLIALARLAALEEQVAWAIRLLGASDALREAIGRTPLPLRNAYRRMSGWIATPLDEKQFARVWVEGRAMTPEQAFATHEHTPTSEHPDSQKSVSISSPARLTAREREVLRLLTMGLTNPQIAERLVISPVTVNTHVRAIYTKFEVTSRSAATRYALLHQLI